MTHITLPCVLAHLALRHLIKLWHVPLDTRSDWSTKSFCPVFAARWLSALRATRCAESSRSGTCRTLGSQGDARKY
eukprot:2581792-Alexandrium_andersonii.AAC.1